MAPRDPDWPLAAGLRRDHPGFRPAPAAIDRDAVAAVGTEGRVIDRTRGGGARDRAHIEDRRGKRQEGTPDAHGRQADAAVTAGEARRLNAERGSGAAPDGPYR